jgi:hypothetical protein
MNAVLIALAALAQEPTEAREVRVYLYDANKAPASLRGVTASIIVPGRSGAPDLSMLMVVEVPTKNDPPFGKASAPLSVPVDGTSFTAEAVVVAHSAENDKNPDPPREKRMAPYFRAVLDRKVLGEDGRFTVAFTIDGERRLARFGEKPKADGGKAERDLEGAVAARDVARAKAALERLPEAPAGDPHREVLAKAVGEMKAALDAGDWEKVSRSWEAWRRAREECGERCAPAPSDERRRP